MAPAIRSIPVGLGGTNEINPTCQHVSAGVALAIRALADRGQVIVLSNVGLEQEGLTRRSKWRALAELERLGLLLVERLPRKSPRVTLCYLSGERS